MNLEIFAGKTKGRLPKLDTIDDKIAAVEFELISEDSLTPAEKKIRIRWHELWGRLMNFHSPTQAVTAHVLHQKKMGSPISTRTAWSDYRKCTLLWGNMLETPKKAKRLLVEEYTLKTFQMATNKKDVDGMNRAIANLIKINALDRPDAELALGSGGGNMYFMSIYTQGSKKPKVINLDDMNSIPAGEYEELMNAVEDQEITDVEIELLMESEGINGSTAS